ncbi:MAG: adenine deaminase [Bacillota bacterium]|jgi:adenine deaminase
MQPRYLLHEVTEQLTAVAMGRQPAQLVITDARLVNVNTGEIQDGVGVAITHGRIALVGDVSHTIGEQTEVIAAAERYLAPGFIDGHIHVESSMLTVREYSRAVVPHGTTCIIMDPHEIANVLGMQGIRCMIEEGKQVPLRVYVAMPSCVPAAPGFEDTGASIGPAEVVEAMSWPEVIGLGELMNFPGVLEGDGLMHRELQATLQAGKTVTGHYSLPETGRGLNAYIASGVRCCHESVRKEDALAKMRLGMYAQLREGSAWHDVQETVRAITEEQIDTRFATLVSDDTHPHTLLELGHMDHILRRAIAEGVNSVTAIQMATINVAESFGLARDLGSVSPGKWADMVLLDDLEQLRVSSVLINGELVAQDGRMLLSSPEFLYPAAARQTVHLAAPLMSIDFALRPHNINASDVIVRVMQVMEAKVGTWAKQAVLPVQDGFVALDPAQDIAKVAVFERHRGSGSYGLGFVQGFGLQGGAVASTVAHDSHNLLIMGMNDEDMAAAGNAVAEAGGGMAVVRDGQVLALLPLPIAGLMSDRPLEEVAAKVAALDQAWKALGCRMVAPFMTMALLALAVLPELRLTNRGLVDTVAFEFVDLIVAERMDQVKL